MTTNQHTTETQAIVVVGTKLDEQNNQTPAFYVAKITAEDIDVSYSAAKQAVNEGGFLPGAPIIFFKESEFAAIREFFAEFKALDTKDYERDEAGQGKGEFNVAWENTISAKDPRHAAELALEMLKDPGEAVVFTVDKLGDFSRPTVYVDLFEDLDEEEDDGLAAQ